MKELATWRCVDCGKRSRGTSSTWRARRYGRKHLEQQHHARAEILRGDRVVCEEVLTVAA